MSFDFKFVRGAKLATAGAVLTVGLGLASAAGATNVTILDGAMHNQLVVNIAGIGNAYDAPMEFHTIYGGTPRSLVAWCVDVLHDITLGDYNPDLQYTDVITFNTSYPYAPSVPAFTAAEVTQVDTLVNYGNNVFFDGGLAQPNKRILLGAVQGAIWQVVANRDVTLAAGFGENNGVDANAFNALVDNLSGANYLSYATGYGTLSTAVTFITPITYPTGGTQSFLFAGGAVPEPATWAMLIGGFGLVGAMLRRRRVATAAAA